MLFYGEERRADGVDHWHPIAAGFVTSLNRPGGTLTGVTTLTEELAAKQLEVLHELKPMTTSVALLVNPAGPLAESTTNDVQAAARKLGLQLHVLHASSEREFDTVFATLAQLRAGGLMPGVGSLFNRRIEQLTALTIRHACRRSIIIASSPLPAA